jgi:c(7)-type cytochrome triheme protein
MPFKAGAVAGALLCGLSLFAFAPQAKGQSDNPWWNFPLALPPAEYGNILINRTSEAHGIKAATFSHWIHRIRFTCRVCHFELEFNMKANTTEITEAANKSGRFCGADGCHDGKAAFGHDEGNCRKCHNGDRGYGKEKFAKLLNKYPKQMLGNGIDWMRAMRRHLFKPVNYLSIVPPEVRYRKTLQLQAEWDNIPPAIFSHSAHVRWLDCNNCHPDIFNIKKKATKHFSMALNLKGEFCGVCHLSVAFPMNDCKKCHPDLGRGGTY